MNIDALLKLNDRTQLEVAGHALSPLQALSVLDQISKFDANSTWKLSAILSGISQSTFEALLWQANESQMETLKHESMTEPLQHHLTLLSHDLELQKNELFEAIEQIENEIDRIDPLVLSLQEITPFEDRFEELKAEHEEALILLDKALKLVWNTDRSDLIDQLSTLKEKLQRSLFMAIGHERQSDDHPTGLFKRLEDSLFKVFNDLKESDPAIDGLKQFGIWEIKDYWELGILPEVREESQLQFNDPNDTKSVEAYRDHLLHDAKQHLAELGLATIQDLKESYVFSKKSLLEYLES